MAKATKYRRICKGCRRHIQTNIPHKAWCSDACKWQAMKPKVRTKRGFALKQPQEVA